MKKASNTSFSVSFVISSPSFSSNGLTSLALAGFMFAFMFLRGFDSGTDLWQVKYMQEQHRYYLETQSEQESLCRIFCIKNNLNKRTAFP